MAKVVDRALIREIYEALEVNGDTTKSLAVCARNASTYLITFITTLPSGGYAI